MSYRRWITVVALACVIGPGDAGTRAEEPAPHERPHVVVSRVARQPVIEDFLDMSIPADLSETMAHVEGFVQRAPVDGAPSTQETHVYLGYDDKNFYAAFVAFDDEPDKIRARITRRENFFGDELVEIQLDTFLDERRAFSFLCNPLGIQLDALWAEGRRNNFDRAWDTVWYSEGRLTDRGYVVLMTIPFKSLRFGPEIEQEWGMVLARDIPRNNENTFWPPISNRIEGRLNQAATLTGIEDISPGRNVWLIPYGTARSFRALDEKTGDTTRDSLDTDIGLDAKIVIKDSLTLDLTANPDFSQVESDQPQITTNQRFEVFFPETRPFFLENADFFQTPVPLVFTRRIRDPRVGARLSGKIGPWSLGALVMDDEAPGKVVDADDPLSGQRALFGILRVKRDVGEQSTIGLMYTRRDFDIESNQVLGFDGRIKFNDHWDTQFQAIYSETDTLDGESISDPAYDVALNRNGRAFGGHFHYIDIGADFRADTGFIRRTDIKEGHTRLSYTFWPDRGKMINWGGRIFAQRILDQENLLQDTAINPSLFWEFPGLTRLSVGWADRSELLRVQDFPELEENTEFSTDNYQLRFSTEFIKALPLNAGFSVGDGINFVPPDGEPPSQADRIAGNLGLSLRLGRRTQIDGTYLLDRLSDPTSTQAIFTNQIYRVRLNWQFDARFWVRLILQYDETETNPELTNLEHEEGFNGDLLLTYLINPWTAVYLGYNSNYENFELFENENGETEVIRASNGLINDSRQLFLKVNYLFQF